MDNLKNRLKNTGIHQHILAEAQGRARESVSRSLASPKGKRELTLAVVAMLEDLPKDRRHIILEKITASPPNTPLRTLLGLIVEQKDPVAAIKKILATPDR